jgi:hypothetical protein
MTNWASKTNYQKLFSECYWGRFPLITWNASDNTPSKEICDNRNAFAFEYKLKKSLNYTSRGHIAIKNIFKNTLYEIERHGTYVDHIEYYDTGYSVVCVTSHGCSNEQELNWIKYGFRKIAPIYCPTQKTFMMELFYDRRYE